MKKTIILLSAIVLILLSCKKPEVESDEKMITKFIFKKANNPSLSEDVEGVISGNQIKVTLHGLDKQNLIPSITYSAKSISNLTNKDFSNPVNYSVEAEDGSKITYAVNVDFREIYIAGHETNNLIRREACYWKNGVKTKLSVPNEFLNSTASAITVNNNSIYIAGTLNSNTNISTAVYWKDGSLVKLENSDFFNSTANAIVTSGNDIYIAGTAEDDNGYKAVYWKNGIKIELTNGATQAELLSIFVSGNDVYAAGYEREISSSSSFKIPAYWKNGAKVQLGNVQKYGQANAVYVLNNDVYVAGEVSGNNPGVYWKNGVENILTGLPRSIASNGTDLYIAGDALNGIQTNAYYWKNSVKTELASADNLSKATAIFIKELDQYIIGFEASRNNTKNYICWINGKPNIISTVGFGYTGTNLASIFVN